MSPAARENRAIKIIAILYIVFWAFYYFSYEPPQDLVVQYGQVAYDDIMNGHAMDTIVMAIFIGLPVAFCVFHLIAGPILSRIDKKEEERFRAKEMKVAAERKEYKTRRLPEITAELEELALEIGKMEQKTPMLGIYGKANKYGDDAYWKLWEEYSKLIEKRRALFAERDKL